MKTKFLLSVSIFFLVSNAYGQLMFQKVIPADSGCYAIGVQQTTDSGYIIVGSVAIDNLGNEDIYLIKTNAAGDTLWTKTFGGTNYDDGYSVQQTMDNGYIIAGNTGSFGSVNDFYLIKTDANGDTLWTKAYGGSGLDFCYYVRQTFDSGYIVVGGTYSFGAGGIDVYLLKTTASGDIAWTKTYGEAGDDEGEWVKQTNDSGYIICGFTNSFGAGNYDVYLIKTDANGDTLWTKTYGGTGNDYGYAVLQTADSGYIVSGISNSFGNGSQDIYLIKTNASGDTLWTKTYGGAGDDVAYDIQQTNDDGYIIVGNTSSFGDGTDKVYLIRTDSSGDIQWSNYYGGPGYDYGVSVSKTNDGGYIITGDTYSFGDSSDAVYLIKTDANGNSTCYQSSANSTTGYTDTQVGSANFSVSSGGTAITTATVVGSAGSVISLCLTTGINEQSSSGNISIYPNPASDKLIVNGYQLSGKSTITIFNALSQQKFSLSFEDGRVGAIDVSSFPSGIYLVRVVDEKESWTGKFVKE